MQSKEENAFDNQYIFRHGSGSFSDVITYRKCLIDEIKKTQIRWRIMTFRFFPPKVLQTISWKRLQRLQGPRDIPFTRFKSCKKPWKCICRGAVQSSPRQILYIVR